MPSIRELRGRIHSVQNIGKITRAMKLVAATRQRRSQDRVNAARPYSDKMRAVMQSLAESVGGSPAAAFADSPGSPAAREAEALLTQRDITRHGLLVVSGERGMCGSYNTNLLRKAMETIKGMPKDHVQVVAVGKKAAVFFRKRGYTLSQVESLPVNEVPYELAQKVGRMVRKLYVTREVDAVHLVYTRSLSAMSQKPTEVTLLPMELPADHEAKRATDFIFEPSAPDLLSSLVPRYVDTVIYQILLEAVAGEQGARMVAMTAATDNARDVVDRLTLETNRIRQARITTEILEVVSGAEALQG